MATTKGTKKADPKANERVAPAGDAKAKGAKKAALKGTNGKAQRKVRTSVSFHRPKTLRLPRTPKYPRKSIPHAPRMDEYRTIVHPVVTESAMKKIEDHNTLVFIVDLKSNKRQIKAAVKKLYDVDIAKINTLIRPDGRKKAYVRLTPDHEALDVANKGGVLDWLHLICFGRGGEGHVLYWELGSVPRYLREYEHRIGGKMLNESLATISKNDLTPPRSFPTSIPPTMTTQLDTPTSLPPLESLLKQSAKRTASIFYAENGEVEEEKSARVRLSVKTRDEYLDVQTLPSALLAREGLVGPARPGAAGPKAIAGRESPNPNKNSLQPDPQATEPHHPYPPPPRPPQQRLLPSELSNPSTPAPNQLSLLLSLAKRLPNKYNQTTMPHGNSYASLVDIWDGCAVWLSSLGTSGSSPVQVIELSRCIVWDLASGELKLSLTGHISTVRGLAVSPRHPYLFSAGEDKVCDTHECSVAQVLTDWSRRRWSSAGIWRPIKLFDTIMVICLVFMLWTCTLHLTYSLPLVEMLLRGSNPCTRGAHRNCRRRQMPRIRPPSYYRFNGLHCPVRPACTHPYEPLLTFGPNSLWDLAAGKTMTTLTHHKKSVRALAVHPTEFSFASGSAGGNNIKKWKCPEGMFVHNFSGHDAIINTLSVNAEGVLFSGGDNGTITLWDYKTGLPFQNMEDIPQPGSLDAEAGVFCSTFDQTGTRLITGGADKTIKNRRSELKEMGYCVKPVEPTVPASSPQVVINISSSNVPSEMGVSTRTITYGEAGLILVMDYSAPKHESESNYPHIQMDRETLSHELLTKLVETQERLRCEIIVVWVMIDVSNFEEPFIQP
ncbi:pre-mRNA-splicing factor PRP46 [Rhizoctonia solani AG-1 IA]|uniref:Pre-mRNA-splicing factor PRP46 n=1 Tax=Thanatephorus cucumeris (strain AG1-IA) TaxID=983506 RepID=L8WPB2_THACA|nr:pre-mRNA-splicing factor PRP46 [Rhizoctonia solani AG-1 IA]